MADREHWVEFVSPGLIVSETSEKQVADRDPKGVTLSGSQYGFRFFDILVTEVDGEVCRSRRLDISGWHFSGEVYDLARIEAEYPDERILISNVKGNDIERVLKTPRGSWASMNAEDVVLNP